MGTEIIIMSLIFYKELSFWVFKIEVSTQKIDSSRFETYGIVIVSFSINNKVDKSRFLDETFLIATFSMNIVLGMLFLILSNAKINFLK